LQISPPHPLHGKKACASVFFVRKAGLTKTSPAELDPDDGVLESGAATTGRHRRINL